MYRSLLCCLLATCAYAQTQSVDSIIENVFNSNNTQSTLQTLGPTTSSPERTTVKLTETCTTDNNEHGVCVLYFLCSKDGYLITTGMGILDVRQRRRRRQSPAEEDAKEGSLNGSIQATTKSSARLDDTDDFDLEEVRPLNFVRARPCSMYLETCCLSPKRPSRPTTAVPEPLHQAVCGQRQPDGVGYYYTQQTADYAKFAEFPWMVVIAREQSNIDGDLTNTRPAVYVGSGSLIHPSVVLTTAHFFSEKYTFKVRAGSVLVLEKYFGNELYPHQDRYVDDVRKHEQYDQNTQINDIALLFLKSPIVLAPNVGLVCLPPQSDRPLSSINCIGSGWGKDKFGRRQQYRTRLKKFDLTLIDHDTCQEQLRQTRLGPFFELDTSFTCADDEATDTCQGDGGSPLVCPIEGENMRYQQHGIVSWGIGCGNGIPTVYVDVSRARSWIDDVVIAKGLDPKAYTP